MDTSQEMILVTESPPEGNIPVVALDVDVGFLDSPETHLSETQPPHISTQRSPAPETPPARSAPMPVLAVLRNDRRPKQVSRGGSCYDLQLLIRESYRTVLTGFGSLIPQS